MCIKSTTSIELWPHDVNNEALSMRHLHMQKKPYVYAVHVKLKDPKVLAPSCGNTCI